MRRMISIMMFFVAALALTSCAAPDQKTTATAAASASAAATPTENAEQLITKLEQDWTTAILKGDVAFSERITADDFTFIDPMGEIETKAQVVEMFKSGSYKFTALELDNLKVKVVSDAAIATYGQTEKSQYQGKDNSGHYIYTDIWLKRNGKWQVVRTQVTKSASPKK